MYAPGVGGKNATLASRVHSVLDRPGGRGAAGLLHSVRHYASTKTWVGVKWHADGYWVATYPDAVVPQPYPYLPEHAEKERIAAEAYFHEYTPRAGDLVMHLGAGAGWEANLFSRSVGDSGHVYMIEAHPGTFEWLQRRVDHSRLTNVTPLCLAVSDRSGTVSISDGDRHQLNRLVEGPGLQVESKTIPQLIADEHIDHLDLVTINIEGAEREAIRGLGDAAAVVRRLAISCHDFLADRGGDDSLRTRDEVCEMLKDYGYDIHLRGEQGKKYWLRDYVYATRADLGS